ARIESAGTGAAVARVRVVARQRVSGEQLAAAEANLVVLRVAGGRLVVHHVGRDDGRPRAHGGRRRCGPGRRVGGVYLERQSHRLLRLIGVGGRDGDRVGPGGARETCPAELQTIRVRARDAGGVRGIGQVPAI